MAFCGYTPTPADQPKVRKTSLGAEESVGCRQFSDSLLAIETLRAEGYHIIAAEITDNAIALDIFAEQRDKEKPHAILFGNEVLGIERETLDGVDEIVYIPMR